MQLGHYNIWLHAFEIAISMLLNARYKEPRTSELVCHQQVVINRNPIARTQRPVQTLFL